MDALVIEEGLEISDTFFRDLAITYRAVAEDMVKKCSDDASFSHLTYKWGGYEVRNPRECHPQNRVERGIAVSCREASILAAATEGSP
jgi:hypothetical protein